MFHPKQDQKYPQHVANSNLFSEVYFQESMSQQSQQCTSGPFYPTEKYVVGPTPEMKCPLLPSSSKGKVLSGI